MKHLSFCLITYVLLVGLSLSSVPAMGQSPDFAPVPAVDASPNFILAPERGLENQWIVVFDDSRVRGPHNEWSLLLPSVADTAAQVAQRAKAEFDLVWEHAVRGVRMYMTEAVARRVARDPRVQFVEQDRLVVSPELLRAAEDQADLLAQTVVSHGATAVQNLDKFVSAPVDQTDSVHVPFAITCDDPDPDNSACVDNWGLDRIDQVSQPRNGTYDWISLGTDTVHIYAIDTGAFAGHDEFKDFQENLRVFGGINVSVLPGDPDRNDTKDNSANSHGTHVAGIMIGATYGVAKDQVVLHPVKFIDFDNNDNKQGGAATNLMDGLNWIIANHDVATMGPAVVNFSGGNTIAFQTPGVTNSVKNLNDDGILLVQSAGNKGKSANDACNFSLGDETSVSTGVLVVGATDENHSQLILDGRWIREPGDPSHSNCVDHDLCGSNFGPCIDLWAPGAHVMSAANQREFPGSTTGKRRLSGTSMAAPHVTGAVAQYLRINPTATPAQVHQAILGGATCGVLDTRPSSPYTIESGSPNILLEANLQGNCP